VGSKNLKVNVR